MDCKNAGSRGFPVLLFAAHLFLFRGSLLNQLLCEFLEFRTAVFDFIFLVCFDGKAYHFGRDGGTVSLFIAALDFFDGFHGNCCKAIFGFQKNALGSQDHSALFLGTDHFDGFPGLQNQLQLPGGISELKVAAFPQGRPDYRNQRHQHRGNHQDFLHGDHRKIPFGECIDIFA